MTSVQQKTLRLVLSIVGPALLALAGWGLGRYDASKLDVSRFVADSTRRDVQGAVDHSLLLRIDQRVTAMYCGRLSPDDRAGCQ